MFKSIVLVFFLIAFTFGAFIGFCEDKHINKWIYGALGCGSTAMLIYMYINFAC